MAISRNPRPTVVRINPAELLSLWGDIARAGGVRAYIDAQLTERGFLVKRRPTDGMSATELKRYKAELKREAAEKKTLAHTAWQAYRAAHIVHLGEGIFFNDDLDFDRFDLAEPEARAAENELPKLDKPGDLAQALGLTIAELRWMGFHREAATGVHYRRFEIRKRSGGMRPIWAPLPRLKAAQRWILREIVEHLPVHGAAHGFLPGRGILSNAQVHTQSKLVLNVDLQSFFPTVTWRRVKGLFRKAGYRDQIATLLALLCTEAPREVVEHNGETLYVALGPRCLPQGAPTSPAITNALCMRLDRRLTGLATSLGWRYTRYADDMTFSLPLTHKGDPKLGNLLGALHMVVAAEGFAINPEKTRVARPGARQKVTGLVVNGAGTPRVPRELRRRLRAAVHNLEQGKPIQEGDSVARLAGYAAFVHMTDAKQGAALLERLGKLPS